MNSLTRDVIIVICLLIGIPFIFLHIEENNKQAKFEEKRNLILEISRKNSQECDTKFKGYARSDCHYHNSMATLLLISQERRSLGL